MKTITLLIVFFLGFASLLQSQIFVDKDGNMYDERTGKRVTAIGANNTSQAPKKQSSGFKLSNLEFGGNFGMSFGDYTSVNISPQVGYKFDKMFTAGAGIGYTYYGKTRHNMKYRQNYASFNLYANVYPTSFIVLSVVPEISRVWVSTSYKGNKDSFTKFVPTVLVGGGIKMGPLLAQIKYDVVQNDYSPYGNGVFYSLGYAINF